MDSLRRDRRDFRHGFISYCVMPFDLAQGKLYIVCRQRNPPEADKFLDADCAAKLTTNGHELAQIF